MIKKIFIGIIFVAALVMIFPLKIWKSHAQPEIAAVSTTNQTAQATQAKPNVSPTRTSPSLIPNQQPPSLSSKASLALDLDNSQVLYKNNIDQQLPIASLTKIMTAMIVADHVNNDAVVTVTADDVNVECSCMGLKAGEQITVGNLLKGLLIPSGNDAAQTLARFVGGTQDNFVAMMNAKAQNLNLLNTHFANPVGLDSPDNYSTAADVAKMTQEFLKYSELSQIVDTKSADVSSIDGTIKHHLITSNKLLQDDPNVTGVKTGFTDDAQGNLVIRVKEQTAQVLTIVLNTPNREQDSQTLIDWLAQSYKW